MFLERRLIVQVLEPRHSSQALWCVTAVVTLLRPDVDFGQNGMANKQQRGM